jgi:hypothetical protein
MNCIYYGFAIRRLTYYNTMAEIAIAVTASSTGISGIALWQDPFWKPAWIAIALISSIAAILKPIMQIPRHIQELSAQYQRYLSIFYSLKLLVDDVYQRQSVGVSDERTLGGVRNKFLEAATHDVKYVNFRMLRKAKEQTDTEIPADSLWMPPQPSSNA